MSRELLFSVTPEDCERQTFRSGGNGGQNQNKRETGVRWVHRPSGAVGECREERSQHQNSLKAWRRMAESPKMKSWIRLQAAFGGKTPEQAAEQAMRPENLLIQGRFKDNTEWGVIA